MFTKIVRVSKEKLRHTYSQNCGSYKTTKLALNGCTGFRMETYFSSFETDYQCICLAYINVWFHPPLLFVYDGTEDGDWSVFFFNHKSYNFYRHRATVIEQLVTRKTAFVFDYDWFSLFV